ncbi:MAG: hypothetical protein ABIN23_07210 [candidate division WOR-3 bacterium]
MKPDNTEILSKHQKEILKLLDFTKKFNFYLAGGTGPALYLGHRSSIDFDFYTEKNLKIYQYILKKEK